MRKETLDRLLWESGEIFGAATSFAVAAKFALVAAPLKKPHVFYVAFGRFLAFVFERFLFRTSKLNALFCLFRGFGFLRVFRLFLIVFCHMLYYNTVFSKKYA